MRNNRVITFFYFKKEPHFGPGHEAGTADALSVARLPDRSDNVEWSGLFGPL